MSCLTRKINLIVFIVIYVLGNYFVEWHHCEVFTSVAHMEYLVDYQFELSKLLRNHIRSSEAHIEMLKKVSREIDDASTVVDPCSSWKPNNDTCKSIESLVKVVRLTRSRRKLVYHVQKLSTLRKEFLEYLSGMRERLPTEQDLNGAALAILRLQETYNLDSKSFIKLTSAQGDPYPIMHLDDLFYLGRTAYLNNKMLLTSQWMESALIQSENANDDQNGISKSSKSINYDIDIRDHLVFAKYRIGNYKAALNYTKEILARDPANANALANTKIIENKLKYDDYNDEPNKIEEQFESQDTYEVLCRGQINKFKTRSLDSKLVCGYKNKDPRLRIKPVKYEIISTNPEIYIFHQMATNYELKVLKRLAYPQLQRATVSDIETKQLQVASYRISKSGWLSDNDHKIVSRISQRMEAVTGLSSKTAEDLQVANYGIGGHYEPHFDWSNHFKNSAMEKFGQGNRIATCLLYLNDIEAGGATVFIEPKVAIWPQKGSVAFWYNLYRNGTGKENTIHAACPVLLGSKWVANKWFHERGQEYTRPCSLKRTL